MGMVQIIRMITASLVGGVAGLDDLLRERQIPTNENVDVILAVVLQHGSDLSRNWLSLLLFNPKGLILSSGAPRNWRETAFSTVSRHGLLDQVGLLARGIRFLQAGSFVLRVAHRSRRFVAAVQG